MEIFSQTQTNAKSKAVSLRKLLMGALVFFCLLLVAQISVAENSFDHDLTGFLLNGVHSRLKCESCHKHGIFKGTQKSCQGCHGQSSLTAGTKKTPNHIESGEQCDDCHTEISWSGARMDHVSITGSCVTCHNGIKSTGKNAGHVQSSERCDECHRTFAWIPARFDHSAITGTCFSCHNGTVATGKTPSHIQSSNTCEDCHRETGWIPAGFNHDGATGTCYSCHDGVRATGKHPTHLTSSNVCDDCHRQTAWRPANFSHDGIVTGCLNCHNGVIAIGKNLQHVTSGNDCESCHSTLAWSPATTFDHTNVSPGTCISCHNGTTAIGKPTGHFDTTLQCDECHTTNQRFLNPRYTHNMMGITHSASVACSSCHAGGNSSVVYSPRPDFAPRCGACHADRWVAGPHIKVDSPTLEYTLTELQDCAGSCHVYNSAGGLVESRSGRHRPTDAQF